MDPVPVQYLPPQEWKDFQGLVLCMSKHEYPSANVEEYGREGQAQDGIDILVSEGSEAPIGVQAKKRRLNDAEGRIDLTGGLTVGEIDDMVETAEKFKPTLRLLIIATTALSDTTLQDHAAKVSAKRARKKKFSVRLWFWGQFEGTLRWNSDMQSIYARDVVPALFHSRPSQGIFRAAAHSI